MGTGTATAVLTASGTARTSGEGTVCVNDVGMFIVVRLLADSSAVLSLGMLCEEYGYAYCLCMER